MNAQIGQLMRNGKLVFYAYIGTERKYVEGSLGQVEAALEGKAAQKTKEIKTYSVRLMFQYPAWDEKEGILYTGIRASSLAQANKEARRMAEDDGHIAGGKGRVSFKAKEE